MAVLKLNFDIEEYRKLKRDKISSSDFLEKILKERGHYSDGDEGTFGVIIGYLMDLHTGDGGSYEIDDFEIAESSYEVSTKKGKVEITYWIYYFYGCSDLNNEEDDYETWHFELDISAKKLLLNIPEHEKRSTYEEF